MVKIKRVPNFDTFSTLIDRLCIENVKLSHFEFLSENSKFSDSDLLSMKNKIETQIIIIAELKLRLKTYLEEIFIDKNYDYIDEERTFK